VTAPYRSFYTRTSSVTCSPCIRRSRSTGGYKADLLFWVRGRIGIDGGHLVYQTHVDPDQTILLCQARQKALTETTAEHMAVGPVGHMLSWNVFREEDGCEIDSDMNPAGSWLVNRFETADGPRWAIQRPWDTTLNTDDGRVYLTEIEAIADAVAGMVSSALSGDEQG
jgi:hypothetical protein